MSLDGWQKLLIDEREELDFFIGEELREMQQEWITEAARDFAARHVEECELMLEGEPVIIGTDHSRMRYEPRHTPDRPFCDQESCPCHYDQGQYDSLVEQPVAMGS